MIPNIVVPILMPSYGRLDTYGLIAVVVSFALFLILGLTISYIAMRKYNKRRKGKIKFLSAINPFSDNYLKDFDNFIGEFLSGVGIGGLCLVVFLVVVFWITDMIMK